VPFVFGAEVVSRDHFDPTARTAHVRNAESRFIGVYPPDELLEDFRFAACRGMAAPSARQVESFFRITVSD